MDAPKAEDNSQMAPECLMAEGYRFPLRVALHRNHLALCSVLELKSHFWSTTYINMKGFLSPTDHFKIKILSIMYF